jgi:hypothetical protein
MKGCFINYFKYLLAINKLIIMNTIVGHVARHLIIKNIKEIKK